MSSDNFQPLVEITRGGITESIHFGAFAIVDSSGELLSSCGNPDTYCFMRSAAKPFQVLPFVEMGGMEYFDLNDQELALMCGSHSGTEKHIETGKSILKKLGIKEENLLCGTHMPFDRLTAEALSSMGVDPGPLHHNCSGKHMGMIGQAIIRKENISNYTENHHPIQQTIHQTLAEMCDLSPSAIKTAIDGCSVPTYAVPLRNAALAYARLCDPGRLSEIRASACKRITKAMTTYPDMVSGGGRFDSAIMQTASGTIICKGGAEAFQALGLVTDALIQGSPALGITFKIADGDTDGRAFSLVALEILRQLGAFSPEQIHSLSDFDFQVIYNQQGIEVGDIRTYFVLDTRKI